MGPQGKHQVWSGGESDERAQPRAFIVFSVGKARQGRGRDIGLAGLNNSDGLGGIKGHSSLSGTWT